jgi:hypothetical protein
MAIVARGRGWVSTDDGSGGLAFPRHPVGAIRADAYGKGVRSNRYGFLRDQVGGNRIPHCPTYGQHGKPAEPTIPANHLTGRTSNAARKAVAAANEAAPMIGQRGGKTTVARIAKGRQRKARRERAKRARHDAAIEQINSAIRSADMHCKREDARIQAAAQREWQLALGETAARLNNGVR